MLCGMMWFVLSYYHDSLTLWRIAPHKCVLVLSFNSVREKTGHNVTVVRRVHMLTTSWKSDFHEIVWMSPVSPSGATHHINAYWYSRSTVYRKIPGTQLQLFEECACLLRPSRVIFTRLFGRHR